MAIFSSIDLSLVFFYYQYETRVEMFGVGASEVILILVVAIIVFGPKRIPEFARTIGKVMANFRSATNDLKKNFQDELGLDNLSDLDPRKIADDLLKEKRIIDIHPGRYGQNLLDEYDKIYSNDYEKEKETKEKPILEKKNIAKNGDTSRNEKYAVADNSAEKIEANKHLDSDDESDEKSEQQKDKAKPR
jgi:sec-independent protein translocase protein TatB